MVNDYIWKNVFHKSMDQEILEILSGIPVFRSMNNREIRKVMRHTHLRHYTSGEVVFKDKEHGLGMYMIIRGAVKIVASGSLISKETVLAELGPGDFFGELALIDEINRSASAVTTDDSDLIAFFRPDLHALCSADPRLANKVLFELARIVSMRLRKTNEELQRIKS